MRISKGAQARAERPVVQRCRVAADLCAGKVRFHEYVIDHQFPAVVLKDMRRFRERMRAGRWNGLAK